MPKRRCARRANWCSTGSPCGPTRRLSATPTATWTRAARTCGKGDRDARRPCGGPRGGVLNACHRSQFWHPHLCHFGATLVPFWYPVPSILISLYWSSQIMNYPPTPCGPVRTARTVAPKIGPSNLVTRNLDRKRKGRFLRGPVPLDWLEAAAVCGGKAAAVAGAALVSPGRDTVTGSDCRSRLARSVRRFATLVPPRPGLPRMCGAGDGRTECRTVPPYHNPRPPTDRPL